MTESLFAASLQTMHDSVHETVALAARVAAKYPAQNLPPALKPLVAQFNTVSVRFSTFHENELVLQLDTAFKTSTFRLPAHWVGACQGEVSKEVRKIYWDYQEERKRLEIKSLQHRIDALNQLQAETASSLTNLKAQLTERY